MNLASDIKHENYENGILFNYDYDSDYAYHNAYRFAFIYYPFKKNKQYRLSWKTQNLGEIPQSLQYYFPEFEQYLTLNNAFTPQNDTNWIAIFVKSDDFVEGCKVAITDVMLTEGSEDKPYEQYGVSPSPDYPSEIETVKDSVEINVVNKNFFDNTLKGYGHYGVTAKTIPTGVRLSVNADTTASEYIFGLYATINLSNFVGKTVRMKAMFKSNSNLNGTYSIGLCDSNGTNRAPKNDTRTSGKEISFVVPNLETGQEYLGVWFYANAGGTGVAGDYVDYTNVIITIDNEDMTYEPYQSQTAIMPIQQEMLEGDYVADVEHHEWGKIESYNGENITTNYISTTGELSTGATVYYKLTTPVDLELTSEQKAIRDIKLYTYKNITNIDVSDKLASIDVTYKKDLETMFNNIIKQIPSSTSDTAET